MLISKKLKKYFNVMLISKKLKKNFIDAVYRGKTDEVESIIKSLNSEQKKYLVNTKNKHGYAPLHFAVESKKVTELLLANGADISIQDKDGKTLLDIAKIYSKKDIVSLLEEKAQKQLNKPSEAIEKPNTDFTGLIDPQKAKAFNTPSNGVAPGK